MLLLFCNIGDGIFDQLTDQEVTECVWLSFQENIRAKNIHLQCGIAVDLILKTSLLRKSLDNVTCVLIVFENFEKCFNNNTSNFNFNSQNSNLSTFNSLNTPNNNRNFLFEMKEDKSNNNKSYNTNSTSNNTETTSKTSEDNSQHTSSNTTDIKSEKNMKEKSNFQNEKIGKPDSPIRIKSAKAGILITNPLDGQLSKYLTKGKNDKTIDINFTNYFINPHKARSPNKNNNTTEESKAAEFSKIQPSTTKNYKKSDSLLKIQKK